MKWIRERDALIAETLAFVQSVTGRKHDILQPNGTTVASPVAVEVVAVGTAAVGIEAAQIPVPARPTPLPAPRASGDFRTESRPASPIFASIRSGSSASARNIVPKP